MSEYQYYEFCRIATPLSSEARKEMASLSSRAQVSTHGASYVYNYGDFRGNPTQLVLKYFDVFFYIANFGTIQLMFKYNASQIDTNEIKKYCIKHTLECKQYEQDIVISIYIQNEDGFGWTEGEGVLPDLLPLYDEIKSKNYQFFRIIAAIHGEWVAGKEGTLSKLLEEIIPSSAQKEFLKNTEIECCVK